MFRWRRRRPKRHQASRELEESAWTLEDLGHIVRVAGGDADETDHDLRLSLDPRVEGWSRPRPSDQPH